MKMKSLSALAIVGIGCLASAGSLSATTIVGSAQIGGSLSSGGVTVTPTQINFGNGTFVEQAPGTGSFLGVTGGTIKNLSGPPFVGNIFVSQFATFIGGAVSPIYFDLTTVLPGAGTLAACSISTATSQTCTPGAGSPFTLQQITDNTVTVAINFSGLSYDTLPGSPKSPTSAGFTTQFVLSGTVPQLLGVIAGGGSLTASSYSGTFVAVPPTTVPEPGAASLLVAGLGLLASSRFIRKYRR